MSILQDHRKINAILAGLLLLALAPVLRAQTEPPPLEPGTHAQSLTINGLRRAYLLRVPPGYDGKTVLPLVVMLHDRGGSAREAERTYGWSEKADRERFFVAYPEALGPARVWNDGFTAAGGRADDAAFLRTLITRLPQTLAIDRRKLFVAGHGSGGMMAHRLGAEFASRVAAIGVVGGAAGVRARTGGVLTLPRPAHPVSVIAVHGKKDDVVSYEGDYYLSAAESIRYWVRQNDCAEPVRREPLAGGRVLHETYSGCDEEAEVTLYTLTDGDHRWPGARATRPSARPPATDLSATDLLWDFFARHHR